MAAEMNSLPVVMGRLTVLRCLGLAQIPFFAVGTSGDESDNYIFASKYCRGGFITADPSQNPTQTLDDLITHGKKLRGKVPLYYSNDQQLKFVSEFREELRPYFQLLMPDAVTIADMLEKTRFAEFCKSHGLPAPSSYQETEVLEKLRAGFAWPFPLFIKPKSRIKWFQSKVIQNFGGVKYKGIKVTNQDELSEVVAAMQKAHVPFLVQRFIAGGDDKIYSFHTFMDHRFNPLGYFVGRKIRTYPAESGESTYLRLVKNEQLRDLSIDLLRKIQFVGPVKLDFKKDANNGQYYLLEINARYNLWHYLGAHSGVNLPTNAYRYFSQKTSALPANEYRTDIRWLYFKPDFQAFLEYRRRGELSLAGWIGSFFCRKVYEIFAWHDPMPALVSWGGFLKKRIERAEHRLLRVVRLAH